MTKYLLRTYGVPNTMNVKSCPIASSENVSENRYVPGVTFGAIQMCESKGMGATCLWHISFPFGSMMVKSAQPEA